MSNSKRSVLQHGAETEVAVEPPKKGVEDQKLK